MYYSGVDSQGRYWQAFGVEDVRMTLTGGLIDRHNLLIIKFDAYGFKDAEGNSEGYPRAAIIGAYQREFVKVFETETPIQYYYSEYVDPEKAYDEYNEQLQPAPGATIEMVRPNDIKIRLARLGVFETSTKFRPNAKPSQYQRAWVINRLNHPEKAQWLIANLPSIGKVMKTL
jgi:hypothetical protein